MITTRYTRRYTTRYTTNEPRKKKVELVKSILKQVDLVKKRRSNSRMSTRRLELVKKRRKLELVKKKADWKPWVYIYIYIYMIIPCIYN